MLWALRELREDLVALIEIDFSHPVCRGNAVSRVQGHRDRKMHFVLEGTFWCCTWLTTVSDDSTGREHTIYCLGTKPVDDALQIVHHVVMPA